MTRPFRIFEFNDSEFERRHKRFAGFVGLAGMLVVLGTVLWFLFQLAKGIARQ